jgi:predicted ATP-grasp superfamily ATP-dependent carboligase
VRANDIPHPISLLAGSVGDLAQVPDEFFNGAILKPRDSQSFMARFGVKAVRLRSRADAITQLERIQAAGQLVLLQEYVPGPATEHYFVDGFVDRTGTIRAIFARRRLRMYPLDFGNSTAMVSVPREDVDPAIASMTALIKAVGYRGIFSAEFKRDYRDNRFKILEVNTRPWWYVEFAARCGVDVCRMAYDDALGRPVETVTSYLTGRRLVFPYYDRLACRALQAEGRLSAREWARSWAGAMQPIFELSDPMPGLRSTARMAFRFLTRSGGGRTR